MWACGCFDPDFHISLSEQITSDPGEHITVLCWSEMQTEAEIILWLFTPNHSYHGLVFQAESASCLLKLSPSGLYLLGWSSSAPAAPASLPREKAVRLPNTLERRSTTRTIHCFCRREGQSSEVKYSLSENQLGMWIMTHNWSLNVYVSTYLAQLRLAFLVDKIKKWGQNKNKNVLSAIWATTSRHEI